jgi:general secretion pathway protein G
MKRMNEEGWTLAETLVAVAIVLIMGGLVGYNVIQNIPKSNVAAARVQIDSFMAAMESYYIDCGRYPTEDQGLEALWARPDNNPRWAGPYLGKRIPLDPWKNPYVYRVPGQHGFPYEIISYGEDGKSGGEGYAADLISWDWND